MLPFTTDRMILKPEGILNLSSLTKIKVSKVSGWSSLKQKLQKLLSLVSARIFNKHERQKVKVTIALIWDSISSLSRSVMVLSYRKTTSLEKQPLGPSHITSIDLVKLTSKKDIGIDISLAQKFS